MTSRFITAGRSRRKLAVGSVTLAMVGASLVLSTEFPGFMRSGAGASSALAELAARSPGVRIGGTALKAKTRRVAPAAMAKPASATPETPVGTGAPAASVLGATAPQEFGPASATFGTTPAEAGVLGAAPIVAAPAPGGSPGFAPGLGGGAVLIGPGGGAPVSPGGGVGAIGPTPTPSVTTPTPAPTPSPSSTSPISVVPGPAPTQPAVSAVPEPATWLMLIVGFGFLGGALRSRGRAVRPV
jgi:hypothetical protein